ncbi:hypothetical protein [Cellulomonas marina]|nr:hypothetical protein [Cellulomonas marina]GIG29016.1 hypothetical protein Cma02nite_16160 [Cellulomonas marina]
MDGVLILAVVLVVIALGGAALALLLTVGTLVLRVALLRGLLELLRGGGTAPRRRT